MSYSNSAMGTHLFKIPRDTYLGSKSLSFTTHSFFSGTLLQVLGSAKSTRALAFSNPNPNRLFTIKPAPFFFHPGLLASGSYSEVQTTKCCISRQVRFGLERKWPKEIFQGQKEVSLQKQVLKTIISIQRWWGIFCNCTYVIFVRITIGMSFIHN